MNLKNTQRSRAFTLVELLVVITVIGILAGLLFPALNMIRQKAWDTAARDLCLQTSAAWNALLLEHRRLPSIDLLRATGSAATGAAENLDGGDIMLLMNTEATSLLNWWRPRNPDPVKDKKAYTDWLTEKGVVFDGHGIKDWPDNLNDLYLERTPEQRKWGLVAPWARRFLANADNTLLSASLVRVLLDTSGDGQITLPAEHGGQTLNRSAVAWVYSNEKKQRIIASW